MTWPPSVPEGLGSKLAPRPLHYNPADLEQLGDEWTKEASTGMGARLIQPPPRHVCKCLPKEPIAKSLKVKLPTGKNDTRVYDEVAEKMRQHDCKIKTSQTEKIVAYVREVVSDPREQIRPYEAKNATEETLGFESRFESGNLQKATQVSRVEG